MGLTIESPSARFYSTVGDLDWVIEPQVELGPANGISFLTRADFVISPKVKNNEIEIKPIAVYCDGYAFHKDQVGMDIAKRMAIVKSGTLANWANRNIVFQVTGAVDEKFEHFLKLNSMQLLLEYLNAPDVEYFKTNAVTLGDLC